MWPIVNFIQIVYVFLFDGLNSKQFCIWYVVFFVNHGNLFYRCEFSELLFMAVQILPWLLFTYPIILVSLCNWFSRVRKQYHICLV